jgi:hypothetical protein
VYLQHDCSSQCILENFGSGLIKIDIIGVFLHLLLGSGQAPHSRRAIWLRPVSHRRRRTKVV